MGSVRDWLQHRCESDAISHVFPDDTAISWRQLHEGASRVAQALVGLGARKGESVALLHSNGRDGVVALFGVLYGGFRATLINLVAGPDAIAYALQHSKAKMLLCGQAQRALLPETLPNQDSIVVSVGELLQQRSAPSSPSLSDLPALSAEDDALLMYTSGTTGRPKGVVHSHASLLAGGWTTALAHALTAADRALCVLPIYHINGLCVTLMAPLVSGGSVVVCERFSARRFWELCDQHAVSWFSVVPTIISHLLHGAASPSKQTTLRFGRSASAPLAPEVHEAFEARFGVSIVETMGLTETAAQILSNPLGTRKIGSPGVAVGNEVCILGPDLAPLPAGVEGEIAIRGPNVMRGYLDNPEANAASFTADGWLRSGDLGRIDEDGYVFVTGRLKELIIKGGENIAPREVDEALYAHADVIEAAAFAQPCERYGERVEAAVVLRAGSQADSATLIRLCQQRLGEFKSPDCVHILVELPKGPSGKIQRLKLAECVR